MKRIICLLPLVPIRKEPSHRSEMTSQLLFGEKADVLNQKDEWIEVKTEFDDYTGWLELKSVETFDFKTGMNNWIINPHPILSLKKDSTKMIVPAGSEFPNPDTTGSFEINNKTFNYNDSVLPNAENQFSKIASIALKFLNAPYLWGGRTIMGIDCSGFVQIIFKIAGIALPRDTKDQSVKGNIIESVDDTQIGDLFFFINDSGQIVHVGMLIEPGNIIHSSGSVRIDRIDNKGIFNQKTGKYTHALRLIKRI